jgi:hypothetical protein
MRRLAIIAVLLWACVATPLPFPPTLDADLVTLTADGESAVVLEGSAGAIAPDDADLRVTWVPGPSSAGTPSRSTTTADGAGAFSVRMAGQRSDYYYIEVITPDDDVFVGAVTGGPGVSVAELEGVADGDDDGSPDDIDCAPADPTVGGRRCE